MACDYDDLIERTLTLLENVNSAWVHYKLDRGIDHVLIDEAQDTSPHQWRIVRALTAEFFVGAGARVLDRTIFAVGDEKQSIFSFQGAVPREFDTMRKNFAKLCQAVEQELRYVPFRHSFRSGPNVLAAVDAVFARPQRWEISSDNVGTVLNRCRRLLAWSRSGHRPPTETRDQAGRAFGQCGGGAQAPWPQRIAKIAG